MPRRVETYSPPWLAKRVEHRPSSHARGYGSAAWQRVRKMVIARDEGVCRACGLICGVKPGDAQVDHVVAKPADEAAEATPLDGLQLLCRRCHALKSFNEG